MQCKGMVSFLVALMLVCLCLAGAMAEGQGPDPIAIDGETQGMIDELIRLINEERIKKGVPPLSDQFDAMGQAAQQRALELPALFSHTRPDGRDCTSIFDDYGIVRDNDFVENVGGGPATPEDMLKTWLKSSQHKANLLSKKMTYIGVGHTTDQNTKYKNFWILLCVGMTPEIEVLPLEVALGQTQQMQYVATPPHPYLPLQWKSENPKVATITKDGLVTAVAPGQVEVTGSVKLKSTVKVVGNVVVVGE